MADCTEGHEWQCVSANPTSECKCQCGGEHHGEDYRPQIIDMNTIMSELENGLEDGENLLREIKSKKEEEK